MSEERMKLQDLISATVTRGAAEEEKLDVIGRYHMECIGPDGEVKWVEDFDNVVVTVGKDAILNATLGPGAYTLVGPFLGLISSIGFTAGPVAADTMTSHTGWTEAGITNAPTYTGPRKTAGFAASAGGIKSLTAPASFAITGSGTVKGAFMALGTGALSTIDNTAGTLLSAGTFADKPVSNLDTLNVSYSLQLT